MRLLVTRPREDALRLARDLQARGHDCFLEPLLAIEPTGERPALDGVQALAATSRHGIAAFARQERRRDLPLFAVGEATGEAARAAGFEAVSVAEGDAAALARLLAARLSPQDGTILHLAGETLAADLGALLALAGLPVRRCSLYRARAADNLSPALLAALRDGRLDGATFLSPRTGTTFVRLVNAAGIAATIRSLTAYCLSPAVAAALSPLRWAAIETAAAPRLEALLAKLPGPESRRLPED